MTLSPTVHGALNPQRFYFDVLCIFNRACKSKVGIALYINVCIRDVDVHLESKP